jgi:hypothetical protein
MPAVGDVVLFGSSAPTLYKRVVPRSAAKAPAPKRAIAKAPASRKAVATVAQPAEEPTSAATGEAPELRRRETEVTAQRNASLKVEDAAVPEMKQPEPAKASAPPQEESISAPVAKEQAPPPVVETTMQPNAAPSAATEPPVQTTRSMAAVEPPRQVRTIPLYQTPTPNPPAASSGMPDWGDEKKLVEVLRAAWKEKAVTRTFRRGEEVPADFPLQPLPPSFASRDAGVNMHYLIANGDAVLVLPGMRVVVEIYHSSTASLQ